MQDKGPRLSLKRSYRADVKLYMARVAKPSLPHQSHLCKAVLIAMPGPPAGGSLLPRQSCLLGESSLPSKSCLLGESSLPGESRLLGESLLLHRSHLLGKANYAWKHNLYRGHSTATSTEWEPHVVTLHSGNLGG